MFSFINNPIKTYPGFKYIFYNCFSPTTLWSCITFLFLQSFLWIFPQHLAMQHNVLFHSCVQTSVPLNFFWWSVLFLPNLCPNPSLHLQDSLKRKMKLHSAKLSIFYLGTSTSSIKTQKWFRTRVDSDFFIKRILIDFGLHSDHVVSF